MALRLLRRLLSTWLIWSSTGCHGDGAASSAGADGETGGTTASGGASSTEDTHSSVGTGAAYGGDSGSGGTGAAVTTGVGPSMGGSSANASVGGATTGGGSAEGGESGEGSASGGSGGGSGTPDVCTFDTGAALSAEIPTVGVVDWSTDLEGLTEARIEFSLDDPQAGEINVASGGPISVSKSRALMLGLKPSRSYTYRIIAKAAEAVCVSADHSLTTMTDPKSPVVTQTMGGAAAARANGFIVVCSYRAGSALIIDADGAVVWRATSPSSCSRAHMDWEGEYMWMMSANPSTGSTAGGTGGDVRRVRMDGSGEEQLPGLEQSHHDFAVLPGGEAAFLIVGDGGYTDLVERSPEGTLNTVVRLDADGYLSTSATFHPNALMYYERDDSYTVSDLQMPGITKFDRTGQVLWRLGGQCRQELSIRCGGANTAGNHGHQLLDNGNLIFFKANYGNGNIGDPSPVEEYSIRQDGEGLSTMLEWSYVSEQSSLILGDVERLPNGNTLVTYSTDGVMHEVSPSGELVQSLSSSTEFGYSSFRETLYGPPQ